MSIVVLIAVLELILILVLVQMVRSGQANGGGQPDARDQGEEIHANEAREDDSEEGEEEDG